MNKRRLLKLAELLEADAKNKKGVKFDMSTWGNIDEKKPLSCGTTACAMGLAALSGAFRRAGLGYKPPKYTNAMISITMNGQDGALDAASELFGIDFETADALFLHVPKDHPLEGAEAERHVAKRIRNLVKTGVLS